MDAKIAYQRTLEAKKRLAQKAKEQDEEYLRLRKVAEARFPQILRKSIEYVDGLILKAIAQGCFSVSIPSEHIIDSFRDDPYMDYYTSMLSELIKDIGEHYNAKGYQGGILWSVSSMADLHLRWGNEKNAV